MDNFYGGEMRGFCVIMLNWWDNYRAIDWQGKWDLIRK